MRSRISRCRGRMWRTAAALLVMVAGAAAPSWAQATGGGIRGVVRDDTGGVLAGVTVEAESPARIGGAAVETTNVEGLYQFNNLPVGMYTVTFSLQGFGTLKRENVRVEVGRTVELPVGMAIGAVAETVTVAGGSPVVDTLNAGTSTTFNSDVIEKLPTSRNFFGELIQDSPGVKNSGDFYYSNITIHGSNMDQNSYQIDGTDASSPQNGIPWDYVSYNIMEAVEVKGVGTSAEYAGFQGGVINVVSKSGGNAFSGFASTYDIPTSFTGNNTPDEAFPHYVGHQREWSAMLGGPIRRDRVWFNGAVTGQFQKIANVGVEPQFASSTRAYRPFAKVTARPSDSDTLDVSYSGSKFWAPSGASRTSPLETIETYNGDTTVLSGRWTRILGPRTVFEAKGGEFLIHQDSLPLSGDLTTPGRRDVGTGFSSVNASFTGIDYQRNITASASLAQRADDFIRGSHDFKFGVQTSFAKDTSSWTYLSNRTYVDYFSAPYYIVTTNPGTQAGARRGVGAFVQDNWTVDDRVTLNLGVRFDHTSGWVPEEDQVDSTGQATGVTLPGVPDLVSFNNVSPRVGFTVKLDRVGKTVAKASYGRYYGNPTTGLWSSLSPGSTTLEAFLYNAGTGTYDIPFWSSDPNANFDVDRKLRNQYTDQFFVGIERELLPDFGLDISFIHKKEHDFIRVRDVTGVYTPVSFVDTFRGASQTLTVFDRVTSSEQSVFQVTNRDDFRHSYHSLAVRANKRFSQGWLAQAAYAWQRGKAFTRGGQGAGNQLFGSLGEGGFGADPNDVINAYGRVPSDTTHTFNVGVSYQAPYGVVLGARYGYQSGRPYARTISVRGLSQGTRTVIAEPSGSFELPATNDLTLRFEKAFAFAARRQLRLALDILNAANTTSVISLRTNSTTAGANFGQSTRILPPRQAMLTARFEF